MNLGDKAVQSPHSWPVSCKRMLDWMFQACLISDWMVWMCHLWILRSEYGLRQSRLTRESLRCLLLLRCCSFMKRNFRLITHFQNKVWKKSRPTHKLLFLLFLCLKMTNILHWDYIFFFFFERNKFKEVKCCKKIFYLYISLLLTCRIIVSKLMCCKVWKYGRNVHKFVDCQSLKFKWDS